MPAESDTHGEPPAPGGSPGAAVTVVIPARNRAALLAETLRSVAALQSAPAAVIVYDDASEEDVRAVAREAGAQYIRNEGSPVGAGKARNAALKLVETPYVWFLDGDDLLLPDAIGLLAARLDEARTAPFAYGISLIALSSEGKWKIDGEILTFPDEERDALESLYVRNRVPTSCALARVADVRAVGGFEPTLTYSEDHALWIELAKRGDPAYVHELIGIHRVGGRHAAEEALEDDLKIAEAAARDPRLRRHRPARDAVLLWNGVSESLHGRRPRKALGFGWWILVHRPRRAQIVKHVGVYIRRRRASRRWRMRYLKERPELLDWLGSFR